MRPSLTGWIVIGLAGLVSTVPAGAQQSGGADALAEGTAVIAPSRLLAGVRLYSQETIDALVELAAHEAVVETLAGDPRLVSQPEKLGEKLPADLLAALQRLSERPEVVAVAVAYPEELAALRHYVTTLPVGVPARMEQLRDGYQHEAIVAARAWQIALANDPVAFGEYRALLTRFCQEQRAVYTHFPCVQVMDLDYYYAAVPDEAIAEYIIGASDSPALERLLRRYWSEHGLVEQDERLLKREPPPAVETRGATIVAELPAEARAKMYRPLEQPDPASLGLMPVMIQPLADRPAEAARALAMSEHARLWASARRDVSPEQTEQAVAATGDDQAIVVPSTQGEVYVPDFDSSDRYVTPLYNTYSSYSTLPAGGFWYGGLAASTSCGCGLSTCVTCGGGSSSVYFSGRPIWRYGPRACTDLFFYYSHSRGLRCEQGYWTNYGYPYPGGPCDSVLRFNDHRDAGRRRGPVAATPLGRPRLPARITAQVGAGATGIGAIRHYPSAVDQVGLGGYRPPAVRSQVNPPSIRRQNALRPPGRSEIRGPSSNWFRRDVRSSNTGRTSGIDARQPSRIGARQPVRIDSRGSNRITVRRSSTPINRTPRIGPTRSSPSHRTPRIGPTRSSPGNRGGAIRSGGNTPIRRSAAPARPTRTSSTRVVRPR